MNAGSHDIEAAFQGNSNYGGAQSDLTQVVNISATATNVLTSSLNPSLCNQSVTFTATVTSNYAVTPTGTIAFSDGSTVLAKVPLVNGVASFTSSTLAKGSHAITAAYSGDVNYASSSAGVTQTVAGIPTTTAVVSVTPAKIYAMEPATITASVSGAGGTPTGTVTFSVGGSVIGTGSLNAAGTVTLSYAFPSSGGQTVIAAYNADTNYAASASVAFAENVQINDSETSASVTPSPVLVYHTVTLTAKVTSVSASAFGAAPAGTVTFMNGASLLGSATLNSSGVATLAYSFSQVGNQNLIAVYAGNPAFQPSQSAAQLIVVQPSATTTTITASVNPQELGAPVTLTATVSSGHTATQAPAGTVTFFDGTAALMTVPLDTTGTAKLTSSTLAIGQHSISASYSSSSADYLSSVSPVYLQSIVAFLGDFSIAILPTAQSLYTGEATQSVTVTLAPSGGWDHDVSLGCGQLPANITCTLNPTAIPGANGVSQLVIQTAAPHQMSASAPRDNSPRPKRTRWELSALGLLLFSFRRRSSRLLRMFPAFILAALLGAMSGCGAPTVTGGTPPGVYNVSVNATFSGNGATLTHSAQFTLTVKSLF